MSISGSTSPVQKFRKHVEKAIETCLRWIFFWESDDKRIGLLIRVLHQYSIMGIVIIYVLVHTFFPSYFLMVGLWLVIGCIWSMHMITGGCVITRIEQRLLEDKITIVDPLLDIFNIPKTRENIMGITLLSSTLCFVTLSFELFTRTLLNIKSLFV